MKGSHSAPTEDLKELARKLGFDLFIHGMRDDREDWPAGVLDGFLLAQSRHLPQRLSDRYQRKWLQIRLGALRRQRQIDARVTPAMLKQLDVDECPVMRCRLTHGAHAPTDWSIDRLNNDGAYAPHNLAISTQANLAKANRSYEEIFSLSELPYDTDGLSSLHWLRLAVLMLGPCFATRPQAAPVIPLVAPLPKLTVRMGTQQIQYACTVNAARLAGKNQLLKQFAGCCGTEVARWRLAQFLDALHQNLKTAALPWDAWLIPQVMQAFDAWRCVLDTQQWARAGALSMPLAGARPVLATRLHLWKLSSKGYIA